MPKGKKYINATGKPFTPAQKARLKRMEERNRKKKKK